MPIHSPRVSLNYVNLADLVDGILPTTRFFGTKQQPSYQEFMAIDLGGATSTTDKSPAMTLRSGQVVVVKTACLPSSIERATGRLLDIEMVALIFCSNGLPQY